MQAAAAAVRGEGPKGERGMGARGKNVGFYNGPYRVQPAHCEGVPGANGGGQREGGGDRGQGGGKGSCVRHCLVAH